MQLLRQLQPWLSNRRQGVGRRRLRPALSDRCEIRPNAQVTRIETPILVLAAGAIEPPRLQLANRSRTWSKGIANGPGQVGLNLIETLSWHSTERIEGQLHSFRGLPAGTICWDFNRPDSIPGVVGGCRFNSATREIGRVGPIAYATRAVSGFGAKLKKACVTPSATPLLWALWVNFCPMTGHSSTWMKATKMKGVSPCQDSFPLVSTRHHPTAFHGENLSRIAQDRRKQGNAGGIRHLRFLFLHTRFGACRMGVDARSSVVNAFGQSHELDNLFIADASVFHRLAAESHPS
jgi:hypothetical protein